MTPDRPRSSLPDIVSGSDGPTGLATALFREAAEPMALLAADGTCRAANPALCELLRCSADQLAGAALASLLAPEELPAAQARLAAGAPSPELVTWRWRTGDGSLQDRQVCLSGPFDSDGERLWLVRATIDASAQATEGRYRELINNANSIILETDLEWRVVFINHYAERFFGYTLDEMYGRTVFETIVPSLETTGRDLPALLHDIAHHPERYGTNINENLTRDGRRVWVAWTNRVTRRPNGEISGLLCVGTDLTELRTATDKLREQEERYRTFIDSSVDGVFLKDEALRYLIVSRGMTALLGLAEHEIVGRTDEEMRSPLAAAHAMPPLAVSDDGSLVVREVTWEGRAFEIREFPVRLGAEGRGLGGYLRDITERQRAADNTRLAAIGQLAGGVAHDFNNMLTALKMRADLTRGATSLEAYNELIDLVMDSVGHGAAICRSLMDFARPEEPCRVPVQTELCLEAALALVAPLFETTGVGVHRDFAESGGPVLGDDAQLQQVFVALFSNACHAMPSGGELRVATRYEDQPRQVVVTVTDHGTGIPPENLRRIFEPFFTTKGRLGESETAGSGLGLAAAHGIVAAHDGSIEVSSELGRGTCFLVRLPLGEPAEEALPPSRLLGMRVGRSARILIADDDTGIRTVIGRILEMAGHEVTLVARADAALAALQQQAPDLAIIDLMMPGGGRQVLEALKLLPSSPPVALITGRLEPGIHRELLALGASVCIPKPFGADLLLGVVSELLQS